ncbi:MAG: sigma-70 family RNA polymerase sigma factor [Prevotellaceae bacterium]|jgi:RNA polymerase sigma-70 factor (ECF subfamily)|nr:sigma-70 family RNA polymerase sigma factor [Prevotellaceae bacterium]
MKNYTHLTDEDLVKLYANGNNDAFDTLLNRHKSRVFSYIFFTVRNREVCEDIFQETFVKAITHIRQGRYVESGKFLSWINRIAHNLIIDYFRREQNVFTCSNDDYDLFNSIPLSDSCVEDCLVKEQVLNDVVRLMEHLPESQREIVRMRFYDDLSFKEIADKTGVSINTALGRMRYAVLNMRRMAEEKGILLN